MRNVVTEQGLGSLRFRYLYHHLALAHHIHYLLQTSQTSYSPSYRCSRLAVSPELSALRYPIPVTCSKPCKWPTRKPRRPLASSFESSTPRRASKVSHSVIPGVTPRDISSYVFTLIAFTFKSDPDTCFVCMHQVFIGASLLT